MGPLRCTGRQYRACRGAARLEDLFSAVSFASNLPGVSVVSMSWGAGEFSGESSYNNVFTTPAGHNGVTFVASSGDAGTTEYPSSSPNVLSVGGTTLSLTSQGTYGSETAWTQSGTGSSPFESQPSWQTGATSSAGLSTTGRTTPDVAFDANPTSGVSVYDSVSYNGKAGWFTVGGTSVGAPSWAGLIAITDQGSGSRASGRWRTLRPACIKFRARTSTIRRRAPRRPTSQSAAAWAAPRPVSLSPRSFGLTLRPRPVRRLSPRRNANSLLNHTTTVLASPTDITTAGATTGTSQSSTSLTAISITALVPSTTSTSTTPTLVTVIIVPAPIPPVVFHLGSSSSPLTNQIVNSPLAASEELPPSTTHFGQSFETQLQKPFKPRLGPKSAPPWLIDIVEPFQPLDPATCPRPIRSWAQAHSETGRRRSRRWRLIQTHSRGVERFAGSR